MPVIDCMHDLCRAQDDIVDLCSRTRSHIILCYRAAAIHGDMDQHSRMAVLHEYKAGKHHVLVATDVAARGLDIKSIKSVINYDAAKEVDTHVHRIGRTGRAGDKEGVAYTLITPYETRFAGDIFLQCPLSIALPVCAGDSAFHLLGPARSASTCQYGFASVEKVILQLQQILQHMHKTSG